MFTGLIRTLGEIRRVDQRGDCQVAISMVEPFAIAVGDSIACHGICLTATKIAGHEFKVSLSAETLACSNAGHWKTGTVIHLEPSLKVGDSLDGHFVSGHVDGVARAVRTEKSGDSEIWEFDAPAALAKYIAAKGSVTLDGVSLTVNRVTGQRFAVNLIPHTLQATCFKTLQLGQEVNLEVDVLARYVARLGEAR